MRRLTFRRGNTQSGFTLIELIGAMALMAVLATLSATALPHFWSARSLAGARDAVVTQLRRAQQQAVSESHPKVFGARFRVGSSAWGLVQYHPGADRVSGTSDDTCTESRSIEFEGGVTVTAASFANVTGITSKCQSLIAGASSDQFIFFFPRGTATSGTLTLTHPRGSRTVTVLPMTGRVEGS